MKFFTSGAVILGLISWLAVRGEPIPVEDFARSPLFSHLRMSPDGEYIAFLHEDAGRRLLYLRDIDMKKRMAQVEPGKVVGMEVRKEIGDYRWITNKRLVFTTTVWDLYWHGVSAIDRDGRNWKPLSGREAAPFSPRVLMAREVIHSFDDKQASVLMLDHRDSEGKEVLYPHVIKVDTLAGTNDLVVKNPGNVISWSADRTGVVRLGITWEAGKFGVIYRDNAEQPWRTLFVSDEQRGKITPLDFDHSNNKIFVRALSDKKRGAVFLIDPGQKELGQPLLEDPEFDVVPESGVVPAVDGVSMYQLIFSRRKKALVGIRYLTEGPRVNWLDPEFAAYQQAIDEALPNRVNVFTSRTEDDGKIMVLSFADVDPGRYYLFDVKNHTLGPVGKRMPWIKPEQMAPMGLISYQARDGLKIHGYLTVPLGHKPKNLPLIVMPHGGPWARDVWDFDPFVQFLANRGYAVLQMNYRGSIGYGREFSEKARREIGRGIQNDIEDGTRWAIARGIADPSRIAILGGSYGGYSALFALGKTPDIYRCGISIAGVSDWLSIIKGRTDEEYRLAYEHWVEQIGDPKEDHDFLASVSPVNFADKIVAPVFIIQGKDDRVVPPKQAKLMISALEKAGHKPEKLFLSDTGHGFTSERGRVEGFKRIEAFLLEHLGPGVTPVMPTEATPSAAPAH